MTETIKKTIPDQLKIKHKKIKVAGNDYFVLETTIGKEFQEILKDCIVPDSEQDLLDENNPGTKRYKAYRWIYPELNDSKEYTFIKSLVDTGKMTLNFESVLKVERFVSNFNYNANRTAQVYLRNADFEVNVVINVVKPTTNGS